MSVIDQLRRWIMGRPEETPLQTVSTAPKELFIDKVRTFNSKAPKLFSRKLYQLGYYISSFDAVPRKEILSSSYHYYLNENLNLLISIEQAPYYTDYGFSIFLIKAETGEKVLLCNVPHERQDPNSEFMTKVCDDFFGSSEVLSLIKGVEWRKIKPLGFGE